MIFSDAPCTNALVIGLFTSIPFAYGTYVMIPIPYSLALQWFIFGLLETIVLGIVVALIYRPAGSAQKV